MTTPLTPARIAQLRAKNAARPETEWPDRYLVDELLDAVEAQQQEIARLNGGIERYRAQLTSNLYPCPVCDGPVTMDVMSFPDSVDGPADYDVHFYGDCLDDPDEDHRESYLPDGNGWADEQFMVAASDRAEELRRFEAALRGEASDA